MKKYLILFCCLFTINQTLLANEELKIYTAQKYKTDFNKLNKDQKNKINYEYKQLEKITNKISSNITKTAQYEVINKMIKLEVWSIQFMKDYKATNNELKKLYDKKKLMKTPEYKLRTIVAKNKKDLEDIQKALNSKTKVDERLAQFIKLVPKSIDKNTNKKDGILGWIPVSKLQTNLRNELSKSKKGDFISVRNNNLWQILFIEDFKDKRLLTFDEAKKTLEVIAKRVALNKKIKEMLK